MKAPIRLAATLALLIASAAPQAVESTPSVGAPQDDAAATTAPPSHRVMHQMLKKKKHQADGAAAETTKNSQRTMRKHLRTRPAPATPG